MILMCEKKQNKNYLNIFVNHLVDLLMLGIFRGKMTNFKL
jgi:hypothetical protein